MMCSLIFVFKQRKEERTLMESWSMNAGPIATTSNATQALIPLRFSLTLL